MEYIVSRGTQTFGPYTEAEVRTYASTGNIVPTDLVSGGELEKPLTVRKAIEQWSRRQTLQSGLRTDIPSPPDLPWWLGAILEIFTLSAFFIAWDIVEAGWLWRVRRQSRAVWYYLAAGVIFVVNSRAMLDSVVSHFGESTGHEFPHAALLAVAAIVLRFIARFSMRRSLCEHFSQTEPIGLKLSWFWTLIFGGLYFQYHFNKINEAKRNLLHAPA